MGPRHPMTQNAGGLAQAQRRAGHGQVVLERYGYRLRPAGSGRPPTDPTAKGSQDPSPEARPPARRRAGVLPPRTAGTGLPGGGRPLAIAPSRAVADVLSTAGDHRTRAEMPCAAYGAPRTETGQTSVRRNAGDPGSSGGRRGPGAIRLPDDPERVRRHPGRGDRGRSTGRRRHPTRDAGRRAPRHPHAGRGRPDRTAADPDTARTTARGHADHLRHRRVHPDRAALGGRSASSSRTPSPNNSPNWYAPWPQAGW